jgi:hypothetical protein
MTIVLASIWLMLHGSALADPVISRVRAAQRQDSRLVDIFYDLSAEENARITVTVDVSSDGGATWNVPATHFSGPGYQAGVEPGPDRQIIWDAEADWNGNFSSNVRFRITACQNTRPKKSVFSGQILMERAGKARHCWL